MFCHNNLLNRKFSFHKIKNVHFTFVPFLTRKKKVKKSWVHSELRRSAERKFQISVICAESLSVVSHHKPILRKGINLPVRGQQSKQIHF